MQGETLTSIEQSGKTDPVTRLIEALQREGFTPLAEDEDWRTYGERVYHRSEQISFIRGETVFVLIDFPNLDDRILRSAVDGITELFRAKSRRDRAFSVLQATTVYVCIIARTESPHNDRLTRYLSAVGGSVIIPVVIVPEINQVVYPMTDEGRIGSIRPRIEYLQYLLGERRSAVPIHRHTVRTLYAAISIVGILLLAVLLAVIT
ncbi:MAG TPA: hypothetical protein VMT00_14725 [Thermoanaerobaculia bacterium]|nr:hypothetical protein [Thermoanaerobaculia bacterium]